METNDEYSNSLTKIYKYRSGNKRDIDTISNNQIWVPLISALNDPCDLSIYCKDIDKGCRQVKKIIGGKLSNLRLQIEVAAVNIIE